MPGTFAAGKQTQNPAIVKDINVQVKIQLEVSFHLPF
jgi:hypothetical protein